MPGGMYDFAGGKLLDREEVRQRLRRMTDEQRSSASCHGPSRFPIGHCEEEEGFVEEGGASCSVIRIWCSKPFKTLSS
jgi:hypothetical protein